MSNVKVLQRSARALQPGPRGYPLVGVLPRSSTGILASALTNPEHRFLEKTLYETEKLKELTAKAQKRR
jgi:hypothetical protein